LRNSRIKEPGILLVDLCHRRDKLSRPSESEMPLASSHHAMRRITHFIRKLRVLKFFILPLLGLTFEIYRWKRQDITHRTLYCSLVGILFALSLIWWETGRAKGHRNHHRHHRHRR
jgi:hypothetical protein